MRIVCSSRCGSGESLCCRKHLTGWTCGFVIHLSPASHPTHRLHYRWPCMPCLDDEEELTELQYEDENLMEMPAIC